MGYGCYQGNDKGTQTLSGIFFRQDELMKPVNSGIELRGDQPRSDGLDRIWPERQTRVSVRPRTTGRGGLMTVGWNRTDTARLTHS